MPSRYPKVSIVIPTCHRATNLRQCLDSISKQTYGNIEVVVVQCEADQETSNVIANFSRRLSIVQISKSGGLVAQMNAGLDKSSGDIVVRTDDDIVASPNWLSEVVDTFEKRADIGGVTGPTIVPSERLGLRDVFMLLPMAKKRGHFSQMASMVYINFFLEGHPYAVGRIFKSGAWSPGSNLESILKTNRLVEVEYLEACNMAIRKPLIQTTGGLDPHYKSIGEWSEVDLSFRIRSAGYKLVFNPRVIVNHMVSRSGVFSQRVFASDRMMNFMHFYFTHIRPDTLGKLGRFSAYLTLLQAYWIYKTAKTGNRHYLEGITGTLRGLALGLKTSLGNGARSNGRT